MRKLLFPLTMVIAMFFVACDMAPTTVEAIAFNDEIVADQSDLMDLNQEFIDRYNESSDDFSDVYDALEELETFLEDKTDEYEEMEAFDEEDFFKKAFLDLLGEFTEISEDYEKLLEMWKDDDVTLEEVYELQDEIDEATEEALDDIHDAQKDFADKYEFDLEYDE